MPKELLVSGRMTQATDIYSFGLMSEWQICNGLRDGACTAGAWVLMHMVGPHTLAYTFIVLA